jgi:uncharacterized damage-inducible protein DinB
MPKTLLAVAMLAAASFATLSPAAAHEAPAAGAGAATMKSEMLSWIEDAESKLNQLAEATPEAKYAWRPAKGVRSVGEVLMHVASANYGVPTFWGAAPPAGYDFRTFEGSLTKKADIQKALRESFASLKEKIGAMSDADMEKPVDLFGNKTTARGACFLLLSHAHEHLGQSIAYARSNNITPPWSAKAGAKPAQ